MKFIFFALKFVNAVRKSNDYSHFKHNNPLNKLDLPKPIFDEHPEYIELYWKAWELAWDHVLYREDSPQKHYIDEAMTPDTIWIWDTLFMALFCKYGFSQFPGIESLNNFYYIIHDKKPHPVCIQHPDNPPFFAWVEYEYAKITGDISRLRWIINEKQYLQKHFNFINSGRRFRFIYGCNIPMMVKKTKYGYLWAGTPSGMDNTPRAKSIYWKILWVDLISQQALSAYYISEIASILRNPRLKSYYFHKYSELKQLVNGYYWDERDGIYYDIYRLFPTRKSKIMTPASFWAMLARIPSRNQAKKMIQSVQDPNRLGGFLPWPTIARNDMNFDSKGQYWRGGVWVPTSYMGTKALEVYGYIKLARTTSKRLLDVMHLTYQEFIPHTIWEAYCPVKAKPSTYKNNSRYVRPDFCGWSALAPISMFIENVIGLYSIDAIKNEIRWNIDKYQRGKQGIKNLRFGETVIDIIYEENQISVKSNASFKLAINDATFFEVSSGTNNFEI